jgi:AraC-like DNA-binding protein
MGYTIKSSDFEDFQSLDTRDANKRVVYDSEKLFTFNTPKGNISYQEEIVRDNLSIVSGGYELDEDLTIHGRGDSSLLELHFNLSAYDILYTGKTRTTDTVKSMSGNLTFLAADDNKAIIGFKKDSSYNTFDVHLPVHILVHYAGESKTVDSFLNKVGKGISTKFAIDEINVSAKIYSAIQEIKTCTYENLSRRIYLEAKILEILAAFFNGAEMQEPTGSLSPGDIERIEYAGQLIRENIANPLTIIDLSRKVGINQTKLKNGFKVVFGDTVFGYLQSIRMHNAKRYLLDTDLTLQEITRLSGYSSLSNFSIAFKRVLGYSPTKLR